VCDIFVATIRVELLTQIRQQLTQQITSAYVENMLIRFRNTENILLLYQTDQQDTKYLNVDFALYAIVHRFTSHSSGNYFH
jgi:hypothetical protein